MRKLLVAVSAVLLVGVGASAAQAQPGNQCPKPEEIKFEQPFSVGQTQGGITITAEDGDNTVTFSIGTQVTVTQICVKAGTTAAVFTNFETDGSMGTGPSITYTCTPVDASGDGSRDLVGPCSVTVTRGGPGLGISHVTFYTAPYVAPAVAGEAVEAGGVGAGVAAGGAAPSEAAPLAFTGAQISIMLAILAGLILAGTLAWTAGRRRAAKAD
jgi:hypothetical protein